MLVLVLGLSAHGEDLVISSLNGTGELTFTQQNKAMSYRVEWASSMAGPWTNSWESLTSIPVDEGGASIMVNVPMVYRVVAVMVPAGFSRIPAGTFTMGSPTDELGRYNDESRHQVTLTRDFYLQKTEVTNQQMADALNWALGQGKVSVSTSTVSNMEGNQQELLDLDRTSCQISYNGSALVVDAGKESYPCIWVTWYGAQAYCDYQSDREGLSRAVDISDWSVNLEANGYRLPTESEWEYTCRAGTMTAFSTGDITEMDSDPVDPNLDLAGWYYGNSTNPDNPMSSGKGTHEVGLKQANAWALKDMHGNVWEWCSDWYGFAYPGTVTDPTGPASGAYRVRRGGGWHDYPRYCRSAYRNGTGPDISSPEVGFRPVRTASP